MRAMRPFCRWARAASGHVAAARPTSLMNSRRRMRCPRKRWNLAHDTSTLHRSGTLSLMSAQGQKGKAQMEYLSSGLRPKPDIQLKLGGGGSTALSSSVRRPVQ
jgi:hypothetical protein